MVEELSALYRNIRHEFYPLQKLIGVPFMLGGGCIGDFVSFGRVIKDYDFFFKNEQEIENFEIRIKELGFKLVSENEWGRQYKFLNLYFDLITWKTKATLQDHLEEGDFTVNSIFLEDNNLYYHPRTIFDCQNKQLVPGTLGLEYIQNFRIKRYLEKGYRLPPNSPLENVLFNKTENRIEKSESKSISPIQIDLNLF
jgi:hypothetical protein